MPEIDDLDEVTVKTDNKIKTKRLSTKGKLALDKLNWGG
jgi:hypothetical protein